jgi:hypothetical protein
MIMTTTKTPVPDNVVLKCEFLKRNPEWSIDFHDAEHRWYAKDPEHLIKSYDLGKLLKRLESIVTRGA